MLGANRRVKAHVGWALAPVAAVTVLLLGGGRRGKAVSRWCPPLVPWVTVPPVLVDVFVVLRLAGLPVVLPAYHPEPRRCKAGAERLHQDHPKKLEPVAVLKW